jgi:hypothetical protein
MSVFKGIVNPVPLTSFCLELEIQTVFIYDGPIVLHHYPELGFPHQRNSSHHLVQTNLLIEVNKIISVLYWVKRICELLRKILDY